MAIESTETKALHIRGIPPTLYTQLKVFAAASNMGIAEYCVSVFEAHVRQQAQSGGAPIILTTPLTIPPKHGEEATGTTQAPAPTT